MTEIYQLGMCHVTRDLEDTVEIRGKEQWKKKVMNSTERGAQKWRLNILASIWGNN